MDKSFHIRNLYLMRNKCYLVLALVCFSLSSLAQSGSALSFDGVDDKVDLPNILTPSYTKEAWIYAPLDNGAVFNNNIVSGVGTAFWFPGSQSFRLSSGHVSPYTAVQDPTALSPNTWYHVAVTYDAATTTMRLYKNGIEVSNNTGVPNHSETTLYIGAFVGANYMKGLIDEVRVWNLALTPTEIRNWMCKKVTSSHPNWANMIAYYNADENSGTFANDSKNTNNGTLTGGTTWVTSGAALGTESAHDYTNPTKTAALTYTATGESFTATNTSGSPDGIHVYRVDAAPSTTTGIIGLGGNNKYFGVFQVGGTSPTYTAVYNYSGAGYTDANDLRLYKRANNSSPSWSDALATNNTSLNTLTVLGESTEYVLGSVGAVLPVNIINFSVIKEQNQVKLSWTTATESNNAGFYIQRSSANNSWQNLGFVPGSGNSSGIKNYTFTDTDPISGLSYYRLKQVDKDGNFDYSETKPMNLISTSGVSVYPIPATDKITIEINKNGIVNTIATLIDANGKVVKSFQISGNLMHVSISTLTKGIYMLRLADGSIYKVVKQ